jgi:putative transposase
VDRSPTTSETAAFARSTTLLGPGLIDSEGEAAKGLFQQVAEAYGMETDTMDVAEDHVHIFLGAPPRYSPARIVQILKSISARELFSRFGWLRQKLWGGELWEDGYFVRSVGDAVTAEVIRRYIRYQNEPREVQLELWDQ